MIGDYGYILLAMGAGIFFVLVSILLTRLLAPNKPTEQKLSSYECGEETVGTSWVQFNFRYYIFALIFVVFDVEMIFLFPWAVVFKSIGLFALIEMFIFIAILVLGLFYALRKGVLSWI